MNKITFTALALISVCLSAEAEQGFQSHASIYQTVKNTLDDKMGGESDYRIEMVPLDSRLQLPECTKPLEGYTLTDIAKAGRVSVGVRCAMEKKWSIFVSALIKVYADVLVLSQPLQRGDIITRDKFFSEHQEVTKLRGDFFIEPASVENKQAARPLAVGTVLGARNVSEPLQIKKGDRVMIRSQQSGLAITMGGVAMMDGVKGQRIRVKNQNSGRIINATVEEAGWVSVK